MFCTNCGGENSEDYKFCRHCGAARTSGGAAPTPVVGYPIPQATPAPGDGSTTRTRPPFKSLSSKQVRILGGGLALIVLLAAAFLWMRSSRGFASNRIMLGIPNRDGETEIYLLRSGQTIEEGTLLAKNALESNAWFWSVDENLLVELIGNDAHNFGGFIPDGDDVLLWYLDDQSDLTVGMTRGSNESLTPLFDSNDDGVYGFVFEQGRRIFIAESRDTSERCYFAENGEAAQRVVKADACSATLGNATVYAENLNTAGEYSFSIIDEGNQTEIELLNDEENIQLIDLSADGSLFFYTQTYSDTVQITLLDAKTGDKLAEGEELQRLLDADFAPQANYLYYIGENDQNELELFTIANNVVDSVETGAALRVAFSRDGENLIYLVEDDDGEKTLYTRPTLGGDVIRLTRGDQLVFALLESPERLLISDQSEDELNIYSAEVNGNNLIALYQEDEMSLRAAYAILGSNQLYLLLEDESGMAYLYLSDVVSGEGYLLVDEWAGIRLLNVSADGQRVIFAGVEDQGDDPILYLVEANNEMALTELDDDAEGYLNAIFSRSSDEILYTANTGNDPDDVEVRQVPVSGEESYEVLYSGAYLLDAKWAQLTPFRYVGWLNVLE